jgi:hypothetical protein
MPSISDTDTTCPFCQRHNQFVTSACDTPAPEAGHVSICWKCTGIAVFADGHGGLALRKPTEAELARIMADPGVRRALATMTITRTPLEAVYFIEAADDQR